MTNGAEFSLSLRVYIEDTDAGGIVYYVNYLKFMERARTELMRDLGFGKDYIFNNDLMFVVRDVAVEYLAPARLDETLQVTAAVGALRGATITLHQQLRRDEVLLARGDVTIACVDRQTLKPRRIPRDMVASLSRNR